jgi:cyclic pyranopterin phosphate synthase
LRAVESAIHKALDRFDTVKLNMVVLTDNLHEVPDFVRYSHRADGRAICRFIELQSNQPIFFHSQRISNRHVDKGAIESAIRTVGEMTAREGCGDNPNCSYYAVSGTDAVIGVIANHSRGYPCGGCRKIRVSPYGDVGICIAAEGVNVRNLDTADKTEALRAQLSRREELDVVNPHRRHHSTAYGFWRWGDVSVEKSGNSAPVNIRSL